MIRPRPNTKTQEFRRTTVHLLAAQSETTVINSERCAQYLFMTVFCPTRTSSSTVYRSFRPLLIVNLNWYCSYVEFQLVRKIEFSYQFTAPLVFVLSAAHFFHKPPSNTNQKSLDPVHIASGASWDCWQWINYRWVTRVESLWSSAFTKWSSRNSILQSSSPSPSKAESQTWSCWVEKRRKSTILACVSSLSPNSWWVRFSLINELWKNCSWVVICHLHFKRACVFGQTPQTLFTVGLGTLEDLRIPVGPRYCAWE